MKRILTTLDNLIIFFKIAMFGVLVVDYLKAPDYGKHIVFRYLTPFIFYAIIAFIRLWRKKFLLLLYLEIVLNIYFILTLSRDHAIYLILTLVSLFINLYLSNPGLFIAIHKSENEN